MLSAPLPQPLLAWSTSRRPGFHRLRLLWLMESAKEKLCLFQRRRFESPTLAAFAGRPQLQHHPPQQHPGVKSRGGSGNSFSSSLLHPSQGNTADEIFLEENKDQQDGQRRDHRAGEDDVPDGAVLNDKQSQPKL